MSGPLRAGRGAVLLAVHAQPGARREGLDGLHGERLRVRTKAPAEGGRANEGILALVAAAFGLTRAQVELISGATSRRKELALNGLDLETARLRLAEILGSGASSPTPGGP